jgi:hypothetical protein
MLRLLYFGTQLTVPSGIRITVRKKLSGYSYDDERNIDGIIQPSVSVNMFHLSAQDSVHYVVVYSAWGLFIMNWKAQLSLCIKTNVTANPESGYKIWSMVFNSPVVSVTIY